MKALTVHQRINFKSHFSNTHFLRIKRVDHYRHYAQSNSNYKSFDIPFWQELQRTFTTKLETFLNKF